ncbi:MAG: carbon-nitrogen hydrolase family protein [Bacteroidota bacterium]
MRIAIAQIAPVWLDRAATLDKIILYVKQAAAQEAKLVVFGETILPGYPFWLSVTDGARFNAERQKEIHAHYLKEAVCIERGDLGRLQAIARANQIAIVLGIIELPLDRGGHSCYCSMVSIDPTGAIVNVHRKLQPTYEERLCWSPGDGYGLKTFPLDEFTVGGLNCWENWMPLPRAALYGQGENLHLAIWPGCLRNTEILTRFLAREGRSYCVSVSGLMRKSDIPDGIPHVELIRENFDEMPADGGSCIANPDGSWLLEPIVGEEALRFATLDFDYVLRERQNFDPAGHYSRPDITQLSVNRERQSTVRFLP